MDLSSRLKQWAQLREFRPVVESPDVAGGRDGELMLKHLVTAAFQFKDASLLAGRRIPSKRQHRRREIDLIVCTRERIHLIEIKNWSGVLDVKGGVWRQTRRNGEIVEHPDLMRENWLRRDAVVEYLHDRGLALPDAFVGNHILSQIIFMNPRLAITPEIESLPEVISRRELDNFLGNQPYQRNITERLFASVIDLCLARQATSAGVRSDRPANNQIPTDQYRQIVALLAETSTWDQMHLYGGKVITGDVIALKLGAKTYRKPELTTAAAQLPIHLEWTRSTLPGLLKALTGLAPLGTLMLANARHAIGPTDTLHFHEVGQAEPTLFPLAKLDRIILG
jgi:hypothetical protein